METRIAAVSIIVENQEVVEKLNSILHDYNQYIIGRLGHLTGSGDLHHLYAS